MPLVVLLAFVGGVATGLSPCILPVLPAVLAGSATDGGRRRPYAIVVGLVLSFTVFTLTAGALLRLLHLPQDFLRDAGLVLLGILAVGLLVPPVGDLLERPFARVGAVTGGAFERRAPSGPGGSAANVDPAPDAASAEAPAPQTWLSGLALGVALGLVFVPCAGPVLAAITVAAAHERYGVDLVLVMLAYACGAAAPLLAVALLSRRAGSHLRSLRAHAPLVRKVAGVVIGLTALAIALNLTTFLQTSLPGVSQLENRIESASGAAAGLRNLSGERPNHFARPEVAPGALPFLGRAPNFTGITTWINTPGGRPLSLSQLRGKVVLVDFWTYSCINCLRSLPHVEAWYRAYHDDGLVVVGVHSPEFPFEYVVSNVRGAVARLGVPYPVAVDDQLATWTAYNNQYWPAEYLIDQNGQVRHTQFGEGDYSGTERAIRVLLTAGAAAAHRPLDLPPPTEVANRTPTEETTPESYLGYLRLNNEVGSPVSNDQRTEYHLASPVPPDELSFGGPWTVHQWEATAGGGSTLVLNFQATDVYLVMGGQGTVTMSVNGSPGRTITVSGLPDLYTLVSRAGPERATLRLTCSAGVQLYDFTFG